MLLSILIPTYNRAAFLDSSLEKIVAIIKDYDFEIVICDNASSDNTSEIVNKWKAVYSNILYYRQEQNLGYDRNVFTCYTIASGHYLWLLGDSYQIISSQFSTIVSILETKNPTSLIMNAFNKIKNIQSCVYNDVNCIMTDLGWYMTHLCSFIISKDFIIETNLKRYYATHFIHLGVFYEYLVTQQSYQVYWMSENCIDKINPPLGSKKVSWGANRFDVFCKSWFCLIMSLPNQITLESKLKCIKDHDKKSHIFSFRKLLSSRSKGELRYSDYQKGKHFIPFVTSTPRWAIMLLFCIPEILFVSIRYIFSPRRK